MFHSTTTDREVTVMFSAATVATLATVAGPSFDWAGGARPGHRPTSLARTGLRAWLLNLTGGTCVFCTKPVQTDNPASKDAAELCHIVSRGPGRKGWLPGNIALGCKACNTAQSLAGPVVSFESIARPELIPTEWPAIPVLTAMGKALR